MQSLGSTAIVKSFYKTPYGLIDSPLIPSSGSSITPALNKSRCACEGTLPGTTIEPFASPLWSPKFVTSLALVLEDKVPSGLVPAAATPMALGEAPGACGAKVKLSVPMEKAVILEGLLDMLRIGNRGGIGRRVNIGNKRKADIGNRKKINVDMKIIGVVRFLSIVGKRA